MGKAISAIGVLIVINVIFYGITYLVPEMEQMMIQTLGLYFPANQHFAYWQFVSNMFMHGGFTHLLFNMYALWAFGTPLEEMWGSKRFLFFYFLSGIGASVIYMVINYYQFNTIYNELITAGISSVDIQHILDTGQYNTEILAKITEERLVSFYRIFNSPAVGASGAIYGVLVAFGMSYPNAKLAMIFFPVPVAAKYFIPALILLDLFSGITGVSIFGGGIAHFAHVGGAVIGLLLMWYYNMQLRKNAMN